MALPPPVRRSAARQPAGRSTRTGCRSCTARRRPGTTSTACPTTPSGTRWPAATPPARPSSSRSTSRSRSGGAPRAPPSPPGSPRCPPEEIHRRPLLTLGQAVAALMAGRLDEVEPLLDRGRAGARAHACRALPRVARPPVQRAGQHPGGHRGVPGRPGADARRRRGRAGVRPCRARPRHRAGRAARRGRALPGGVRRLARGPGGGRRARAGGRVRRAGRVRPARPRAARRVRPRRGPAGPGAPACGAAHLRAGAAGHGGRSTVAVRGHVARRARRGALRTRRAGRRAPAGRRRASSNAAGSRTSLP